MFSAQMATYYGLVKQLKLYEDEPIEDSDNNCNCTTSNITIKHRHLGINMIYTSQNPNLKILKVSLIV
jgi:hypothetical protein